MMRFLQNVFKESFWLKLLVSGVEEEDFRLFSRTLFAKSILIVMAVLVSSFTVYHFIFTGNYLLGFLLFVSFLYMHLKIKKSIQQLGHYAAIGLITIFLVYIVSTKNENMSFIWLVFIPFFIILLNGWKVGVLYVLAFYAVVVPLAYLNIGVWDNGHWNSVNFYRLVATLFLGMFMAIFVDLAQTYAHKRELKLHAKENEYVEELKKMSRTDGLTGLYNRYYFNKTFSQKIEELDHEEHALMFFIVDIDNFKAYNDFYGHPAGDEVIQSVAKAIKDFVHRENDLVFRLGGEEFGGLLEARDAKQMAGWLSRLPEVIESLNIKHAPGLELPWVTISGGVSAITKGSNTAMKELYKKADTALYQAKKQGRNRFVIDLLQTKVHQPGYDEQLG